MPRGNRTVLLILRSFLDEARKRIRKLKDGRLDLPSEVPFTEAHNTWVANHPGTLLVIPVGDAAQHLLLALCYLLQNGSVITDDINKRSIPGIEKFGTIVDVKNAWPLSLVEQQVLAEVTVELSCSCYAGALMLQAMGLGGWMFDGLDSFAVLGASGNPEISGLGFRYDVDDRWPYANPTGLPGVMEGFCPPHYADMRSAVEAVASENSVLADHSTVIPQVPGRIQKKYVHQLRFTARSSRNALHFKHNIFLIRLGNFQVRYHR